MSNEMFTQWNSRQQRHSRFHSCLPFEIDVNHSEAYFTGELSSMPAPLNSQDYSTGELVPRTPAFQPLPLSLELSAGRFASLPINSLNSHKIRLKTGL
jgi:hypothetical protein